MTSPVPEAPTPHTSSGPAVDTFAYDNRSVRQFAIATAVWGVVAFLVGLIVALKLVFPEMLGAIGPLSYGRLRPLHTNAAIFAFAGLLPCGMVYAALATALAAGTIEQAVWTMAAFGAGTVPALAGLSLGAAQISPDWRRWLSRAAPIGLALVGVLLLVRGLTPPPAELGAATSRPVHAAQGHRH